MFWKKTDLNNYFDFGNIVVKDYDKAGREIDFRYKRKQSLFIYYGPEAWLDIKERDKNKHYRDTVKLKYGNFYLFSFIANDIYDRTFINVNDAALFVEWTSK